MHCESFHVFTHKTIILKRDSYHEVPSIVREKDMHKAARPKYLKQFY